MAASGPLGNQRSGLRTNFAGKVTYRGILAAAIRTFYSFTPKKRIVAAFPSLPAGFSAAVRMAAV
jgi:hypothetical protein